ncbi:MAG: hypothetical protein IMZ53_14605 [Thermoplasmata archaeon]|nr:hypothetical protein [Thermoplasmata archaeon]
MADLNKIEDIRKPLYVQAIEVLTTFFEKGKLKLADEFPSEMALAVAPGFSR